MEGFPHYVIDIVISLPITSAVHKLVGIAPKFIDIHKHKQV